MLVGGIMKYLPSFPLMNYQNDQHDSKSQRERSQSLKLAPTIHNSLYKIPGLLTYNETILICNKNIENIINKS